MVVPVAVQLVGCDDFALVSGVVEQFIDGLGGGGVEDEGVHVALDFAAGGEVVVEEVGPVGGAMPPAFTFGDYPGRDGLLGGVKHILPGIVAAFDAAGQGFDLFGAPAQLAQERLAEVKRAGFGVLGDAPDLAVEHGRFPEGVDDILEFGEFAAVYLLGDVDQVAGGSPVADMLVAGDDDVGGLAGVGGQLEFGLVVAPSGIVLDGFEGDAAVVVAGFEFGVDGVHGGGQVVAAAVLVGRAGLAAGHEVDGHDLIGGRRGLVGGGGINLNRGRSRSAGGDD